MTERQKAKQNTSILEKVIRKRNLGKSASIHTYRYVISMSLKLQN